MRVWKLVCYPCLITLSVLQRPFQFCFRNNLTSPVITTRSLKRASYTLAYQKELKENNSLHFIPRLLMKNAILLYSIVLLYSLLSIYAKKKVEVK